MPDTWEDIFGGQPVCGLKKNATSTLLPGRGAKLIPMVPASNRARVWKRCCKGTLTYLPTYAALKGDETRQALW